MIWLALGTALLLFGLFAIDRFVKASPAGLMTFARRTGLGFGFLISLLLLLRGQIGLAAPLFAMLFAAALREMGPGRWPGGAGGSGRGRQSRVSTASLDMTLDHDTGDMDGTVRTGPFAGRLLSELGLSELRALHAALQASDPDGARLVEAFAARTHGGEWAGSDAHGSEAGAGSETRGSTSGIQSREEAYAVLGLEAGASDAEIRAAHRRLMKTAHPDRGGSAYLAARINAAKDFLLD